MGQLNEYLNAFNKQKPVQLHKKDEDYVKKVWIQINKAELPGWIVTNKEVNRQIVKYIARSKDFNGDLNKGILLIGENGTGKSRMLKAMALTIGFIHGFKFKIYSGLELEDTYKNGGDAMKELEAAMLQKMFGVDDLGEEHDLIKVYGTDINVGVDVISRLYNHQINSGSVMFGNTNLTPAMLAKKYGKRIESRLHEMVNVIYLTGNDLRKLK